MDFEITFEDLNLSGINLALIVLVDDLYLRAVLDLEKPAVQFLRRVGPQIDESRPFINKRRLRRRHPVTVRVFIFTDKRGAGSNIKLSGSKNQIRGHQQKYQSGNHNSGPSSARIQLS